MKRGLSITVKLTLTFVLFAALVVALVGIPAYRDGRDALQAAIVSDLFSIAFEKQARLEAWIQEGRLIVTVLAASPAIRTRTRKLLLAAPGSAESASIPPLLRDDLRGAGSEQATLSLLMLIDARSARVIAATAPEEEGTFKEDRPFFLHGKEGQYIQNADYSLRRQAWEMVVSAPVRGPDGRTIAVIAGILDPHQVSAIVGRRTGLHHSVDAFLVNKSNRFVTQPRFVAGTATSNRGAVGDMLRRDFARHSAALMANDHRGMPVIAVFRWLPARQLGLVVQIDQAEAFAPVMEFGRQILLTGVLVLLAASALALGLAHAITGPVLALRAGAVRFASGDVDVSLPETSRDELGELTREFNAMARTIAGSEAQLKQRAVELTAANRELESFSYSVSHDLRAPLRAIAGFTQILADKYREQFDAAGQGYLGRVISAADRMGQLIDDLLKLSSVTRAELQRDPVDVSAIARNIAMELRQTAPQRQAEFIIADDIVVNGDSRLLRIVLENLLGNAWKFTSKQPAARIEFGSTIDSDGRVVCSVRDNGAGFDMSYAGKLFGAFQRLHGFDEFPGTGIGLATVQRIIYRHGGRVWAEGAIDQGATLYFSI